MSTCETCKWWVPSVEDWDGVYYPIDPDTYKPMVMPFEIRKCTHPAQTFCERPVERNGFGVADGSTYRAELFTGPDFGCVRHEGEDQ